MADINIQPKKPSPWSYVLYGVALLAIAFLVFRSTNRSNKPVETQSVVVDTNKVAGSVNAFISYIHNTNPNEETGSTNEGENSPQFASYGLHLLSAAIGATVVRDEPKDEELNQMRQKLEQVSDSINSNWDATSKAQDIRMAFISAADLLNELQERHYPELKNNIQQLHKEAEAINPGLRATEQSVQVKKFFEQSGQVLQAMVPKKQNASIQ
ncbi:MAG: hypothetical protein ACM34K_07130 [Bacillota bacterium]